MMESSFWHVNTMVQSKAEKRPPPDGEAPPDARRVHAHGLGATDKALPIWGVVGALEEVQDGAANRAHPERAAHVVQDAVQARLPRCLRRAHLPLLRRFGGGGGGGGGGEPGGAGP